MAKQDLISIIEIAKNHGRRSQSIHKIVKRLGITTTKLASTASRGQKVSHITREAYEELERHLTPPKQETSNQDESYGVFYLVLLEPSLDPGRFKVGFATNINERIRHHKTVAPLLEIVKTWPCKLLWEKTAIECVTAGCEQIYTEVFRTDRIQTIIDRADQFFELMPRLVK